MEVMVSFMLQPLYPRGKILWLPLDKRLGETWSQCGCCREEKNILLLLGIEPLPFKL
jgi:hypothetical protein